MLLANLIAECHLHFIYLFSIIVTFLQVELAQAGIESLALSQKTINELRGNFVSIEKYESKVLWIIFIFECEHSYQVLK